MDDDLDASVEGEGDDAAAGGGGGGARRQTE